MTSFQPDPEQVNFTFKNLQQGYAAIGYVLSHNALINNAIKCYRALSNSPAAYQELAPENMARTLHKALDDLKNSARHWQDEPRGPLYRDYPAILAMAHDDCARPLSTVDEAANLLRRAMRDDEHARTACAIAGTDAERLHAAYKTLDRLRIVMQRFTDSLKPIRVNGHMGLCDAKGEVPPGTLARPVAPRPRNPHFTQEALFWAIVGVLTVERESILDRIVTLPESERVPAREAFLTVADTVSRYAQYAIERPEVAVAQLKRYIPHCVQTLDRIHRSDAEEAGFGPIDILRHCISELDGKSNAQHERDP